MNFSVGGGLPGSDGGPFVDTHQTSRHNEKFDSRLRPLLQPAAYRDHRSHARASSMRRINCCQQPCRDLLATELSDLESTEWLMHSLAVLGRRRTVWAAFDLTTAVHWSCFL
jgi:hypothetical protein